MARKSLPPDEADRIRGLLAGLLRGTTQSALAKRIGVRQQNISEALLGGAISYTVARRIVDFVGVGFDEAVQGKAPATPLSPPLKSLPGWAAAEQEARRRSPPLPEEAWRAVAEGRHPVAPEHVTPQWIAQMAFTWAQALPPKPTQK